MTVVDSDVLIDALRGREPARLRIRRGLQAGGLRTTAINVFELRSGARSDAAREAVEKLLAPFEVLPVDARAADLAADLRRALEAIGQGIGTADYLIAGVCLAHVATLLTHNRSDFERVPGLRLAAAEAGEVREAGPGRPPGRRGRTSSVPAGATRKRQPGGERRG